MIVLACVLLLSLLMVIKRSVSVKTILNATVSVICYLAVVVFIVATFSSAIRKSSNKASA